MRWHVLYDNWDEAESETSAWSEIQADGLVRVSVIFDNGNRIEYSGWDVYALEHFQENEEHSIRVTVWKDEEPSDPYYGLGRSRLFNDEEVNTDDTGYIAMSNFYHIPPELRKRGRWVTDPETARAMNLIE